MAKKIQRAKLVIAEGCDLNNYATDVQIPLNHEGLVEVTVKFTGAALDVDPDTRQIVVTLGD